MQGFTFSLIGFSSSISIVILIMTMGLSYLVIRIAGRQVEVE